MESEYPNKNIDISTKYPDGIYFENDDFVTVQEAAERMGINQRRMRYILQQGKVDFGFAYQCDGNRYQYMIFRKDLEEFIRRHSAEY